VIGLHEDDDGDAAVYFGPVQLGTIDGITVKFESRARRPMNSPKPGGELPTRPTASGTAALRFPAVDLWTTRQSMKTKCEKVLPMLPMLPD
jgi:hypothetical protein